MPEVYTFPDVLCVLLMLGTGKDWFVGYHSMPHGWSFCSWDGREFHSIPRFNMVDVL